MSGQASRQVADGPRVARSEVDAEWPSPSAAPSVTSKELAAAIARLIRDAHLPSGARLPREYLAARFRTPSSRILDALAVLERQGVVSSLPRRGYRVV